jgi:hypothetical protein
MGGEAHKSERVQERLCKRPNVKQLEELYFDESGTLSNLFSQHYYAEHEVMTLETNDTIDSDLEDQISGHPSEACTWAVSDQAALGSDLSVHMGKDTSKSPLFARFALPPADLQEAVQEMRKALRARRLSKSRSWSASYRFTSLSLKRPKFERFANPANDIQTLVQDMRLAAMMRCASKQETLPTDVFDVAGLLSEAVANFYYAEHVVLVVDRDEDDSDSDDDVSELRDVTEPCEIELCIDISAHLGKDATKLARFARFRGPVTDIRVAVEDMRRARQVRRDAKKERLEDMVVIEDVQDQERELHVATPAAQNSEVKMLTAPMSSFEEAREDLQSLLDSFRKEVAQARESDIATLARSMTLPVPRHMPLSFSPVEPQADLPCSDSDSLVAPLAVETQVSVTDIEAEVVTLCQRCVCLLSRFYGEAATHESAQKLATWVQEEYCKKEAETIEQELSTASAFTNSSGHWSTCSALRVPMLRTQMLRTKTPNTVSEWVAGSPASAARRMRRSTPNLFHTDADESARDAERIPSSSRKSASKSSKCSAMALDLGQHHASGSPLSSLKSYSSNRSQSMGAVLDTSVKVSKNKLLMEAPRPLRVSKSSTSLAPSSILNAHPSNCWMTRADRLPFALSLGY